MASKIVFSSQYGGGFNGGETSFAHIYVRAVCEAAKKQGVSCACLFVDVIAAFASLLRRIIFDVDDGDEAWIAKFRKCGFSEVDIKAIYDYICNHTDMHTEMHDDSPQGKVDAYCHSISEQWYTNSWASQDGLPHVIKVDIGSAAGVPLADLLHSLAMAKILSSFRDGLSDAGVSSTLNINGVPQVIDEASFVDDVVVPIVCGATHLSAKVSKVCSVAISIFTMFGVSINFSAGKTEVSICARGPGSKAVMRKITLDGNIIQIVHNHGSAKLLVVSSYRHVGTVFSADGRPDHDVAVKCGTMRHECSRINRFLFSQSGISVERKIQVLQTYILSKRLFQSSTWPALSPNAYRRLHNTVVNIYRNICAQVHFKASEGIDVLSNDDLINDFGLMIPYSIVRLNRIMLMCRIVRKQPPGLLDLIESTAHVAGSWAHTVRSDLEWCCTNPKLEGCSNFSFREWSEHIRNSSPSSRFPRIVRFFLKSSVANISVAWKNNQVVKPLVSHIMCDQCPKSFCSEQSLALHRFNVHGVKNAIRWYVDGVHCPVCLKLFWSRERVVNHLRYRSKVCLNNDLLRGPCLSVAQSDELDALEHVANAKLAKHGRRSHFASCPAVQLHGPLLHVFCAP